MNLKRVADFQFFSFFLLRAWKYMSKTRSLSINIFILMIHNLNFQPRFLFWVPESSISRLKYFSGTSTPCIWDQVSDPLLSPTSNNNWSFKFPHLRNGHCPICQATDEIRPSYLPLLPPQSSTPLYPMLHQVLLILLPWYLSKETMSLPVVTLLVQVTCLNNYNNVLLLSASFQKAHSTI